MVHMERLLSWQTRCLNLGMDQKTDDRHAGIANAATTPIAASHSAIDDVPTVTLVSRTTRMVAI